MYKFLLIAVSAVFLSACSEPDQLTSYDGDSYTYSGKTDAQPWTSATFQGDKTAWDRTMKQRTGNQNEYGRTN